MEARRWISVALHLRAASESYRPKMQLSCEYKQVSCFPSVEHTLHRNTRLSTLRFCGVFCTTANIRTLQRMVFTPQQFAVSQKNRIKAITISPFSLPLLYRAKNRYFSTLRCTKTDGTQPKLSAVCFVVQSCLADADFVVFSNYCLIGTRLSFRRTFSDIGLRAGRLWTARKDV